MNSRNRIASPGYFPGRRIGGGVANDGVVGNTMASGTSAPAPPFTFMCWLVPFPSTQDRHYCFFGGGSRNQGAWDPTTGSGNSWFMGPDNVAFGNACVGKADHIAVVTTSVAAAGNNASTVFYNGIPALFSQTGVNSGGGGITLFGLSTSDTLPWAGQMWDWKVWSRALTNDEVLEEMLSPHLVNHAGIHSWLPLDNPSANTAGRDYSGKANHYTLNSAVLAAQGNPICAPPRFARKRGFVVVSANITLAITGVAGTTAIGTLAPSERRFPRARSHQRASPARARLVPRPLPRRSRSRVRRRPARLATSPRPPASPAMGRRAARAQRRLRPRWRRRAWWARAPLDRSRRR